MQTLLKRIFCFFLCFFIIFILLFFKFIHSSHIAFNDITWEYLGGKENLSIIKDHSKTIISPANIMLWGKYPYIAGNYVLPQNIVIYFIYDMKEKKIIYSDQFAELRDKYNLSFSEKDFVTFQDLKGQWANSQKYNQLKQNLQKTSDGIDGPLRRCHKDHLRPERACDAGRAHGRQ